MFYGHIRAKQAMNTARDYIRDHPNPGKAEASLVWLCEYVKMILENGKDAWAMGTQDDPATRSLRTVCGPGSVPDFLLLPAMKSCDVWTYCRIIDWINREYDGILASI